MDMRIEAAAMVAEAEMSQRVVVKTVNVERELTFSAPSAVVSFSCPSISGHSISAVAPDHIFKEELAKAA